jgi:hypothetical protein
MHTQDCSCCNLNLNRVCLVCTWGNINLKSYPSMLLPSPRNNTPNRLINSQNGRYNGVRHNHRQFHHQNVAIGFARHNQASLRSRRHGQVTTPLTPILRDYSNVSKQRHPLLHIRPFSSPISTAPLHIPRTSRHLPLRRSARIAARLEAFPLLEEHDY